MKTLITAIAITILAAATVQAAGSPSTKPSVSKEIASYNEGVRLMLNKQFAKAEARFRKALKANERFAEAHNNLAYTLRKQGPDHYREALRHYNRAIELKPDLPEPYMYRGVLHVQMGNRELARIDQDKLVAIGSPLAEELDYVITSGAEKEPERFFGVSRDVN